MKVFTALFAAFATVSAVFDSRQMTDAPVPGALSMYLNTTSINNVMATFVPIMSYYALNNKTIPMDVHEKNFLYTLDLSQVHINTVSGYTTKVFEEIPGTDKIHVKLGGIDIDMTVDGEIKALHIIPMKASALKITNMVVDFTIESTSSDGVHWALVDSSKITIADAEITMSSKFLQKLVNLSRKTIDKAINDQLVGLSKAIDTQIKALNAMVANEGPTTFVFPAFGGEVNLNMTMTTAPKIATDSKLIELFFNGMFVGKGEK